MNLVIDKEMPRPTSMIMVHAKGYFGDGDENLVISEQYLDTEEGRTEALALTRVLTRLTGQMGKDMETSQHMRDWCEANDVDPDMVDIPVDSCTCEMLPRIESVSVLLYDKDGRTFKMKLGY